MPAINSNILDHVSEVMSDAQVRTVMGRSLRDILCDNTGITHAQPDVFV